jgi:hypothetical protein
VHQDADKHRCSGSTSDSGSTHREYTLTHSDVRTLCLRHGGDLHDPAELSTLTRQPVICYVCGSTCILRQLWCTWCSLWRMWLLWCLWYLRHLIICSEAEVGSGRSVAVMAPVTGVVPADTLAQMVSGDRTCGNVSLFYLVGEVNIQAEWHQTNTHGTQQLLSRKSTKRWGAGMQAHLRDYCSNPRAHNKVAPTRHASLTVRTCLKLGNHRRCHGPLVPTSVEWVG